MTNNSHVKALLFDVFGTVVDYRSTIIKEGEQWNKEKGLSINWEWIADNWRGKYRPTINRILNGDIPWINLDAMHRMALDTILSEAGINEFSEEEIDRLNRVWHRLEPWGDAVPGLSRLKQKFIISPLSNGNVSLLTNMAKHSGLPWDLILSPELVKSYKPDPDVYLMAATLLDLKPEEIMMVAAHQYDLQAAKELGFQTAYVLRPLESGYKSIPDLTPEIPYNYVAYDFVDLAKQLGV